ncbi:MAG: hypothetical protein P4L98_18405 [Ancalomicrobiaceae bacterium]|nr:hypothetical protein [Ancalomicrobiaceae bacterium]
MTKPSIKITASQLETAVLIEREASRLRELALKSELKFLAYLIDMAREEAASYGRGERLTAQDPRAADPSL